MESITFAADERNISVARRFIVEHFAEHDLDSSVAELLTSELVTNVVRHARTEIGLVVRFDPSVRIEVHDGVAATEAFRELFERSRISVPADALGGRGLPLLRALAGRYGLDDEPGTREGKIVWFELDATLAVPGGV